VGLSEETVEFSEQIDLSEADEGYPGGEKELKDSAGSHAPRTLLQIDQETDAGYGNIGGLRCQRGQPCHIRWCPNLAPRGKTAGALIGQIESLPTIRAG
jgi:hypothetical protein